ncbi:MAG: PKD domain-containing protein, partial [Bacteroidia bacterium]
QLTATNIQGCTSILTKSNYIHKLTTDVLAIADSTEGCFPFSTNFSASTNALTPIVSYLWEFGNGDTSSQRDLRYTYPDTGQYFAKITVTDQMGCKATSIKKIRLGLKPRAFFTVDSTEGCSLGLNPKFKSQSQDSSAVYIDKYKWDFGHSEVIGPKDKPNPETYYYIPPGKYTVMLVVGNRGCYDTLKKTDLIQVKGPHAAIGDLSNPCVFDVFKAVDGSFGGNKKWWTYSDGTTEYDPDSIYRKFSQIPWQAAYYITDTITGCWDSVKFSNGMIMPYAAYPKFDGTRCAPAQISYKSFLLNVDSVYYEFSNGFSTSDSSFTVLFEEPGIYSRKLTITSSQGCSSVIIDSFEIEIKGIKANGRLLNDSFCVPGKLKLLDLTDDLPGIVEKKWVIRDYGQFDVIADTMEYEFLTPPPFQQDGQGVYLTVSDDAGCTSRKDFRVYPFAPKPSVSINQEADCNQARYRFKVLNVGKAGFEPVDYVWYFPGGSSNNSQYLGTLPPDVWNNVVLRSIDNFGCTRMDTFPVFGKGGKIKTAFEVSPKFSSCPPLLVSFSDSSLPGEDPIISWKWDFGDGSTSNLKNPKKNYLVPGNYSIKLQVEDSKGCKSERFVPGVVLVEGPTGTYTFTPSEACARIDVNFSSTNSGATKIEWDLGDGNLGHGASLSHTYVRPGRYIPLMILSNAGGCKYSLPPQDTIFVREEPVASFVSDEGCVGTPQALSSNSMPIEGTLVEELWFYDNTLIGSGSNISRTFGKPGLESILLRVKTSFGCIDTAILQVKVPGIAIRVTSPDSLLCLGEPAVYEVISAIFMDSITGYRWEFGDGDSLYGIQNLVQHQYPKTGPYRARVEAVSQRGCIDSSYGPFMMVGDTIPPDAPYIHRVSIGTNMEFIAEYAPSKHIDFNQYLLELQEEGSDFYVVANRSVRNDTSFVHPSLNTLHQVYRFRVREENACGKISQLQSSIVHGSIELHAQADTNAVHLNWNNYEGWLPEYYVIERENESDPSLFDSIAFVSADSLHFVDTLIRCYSHPNYRIRAVQAEAPKLFSRSDTSKASPPHRPELPIHDLKRISVEYDREILSEWREPFYSKFPITGYLLEYSKDGKSFYSVKDWLDATRFDLTKTPLLVDDQSYYFRIRVKDSCGDVGPPGAESRSVLLRTEVDSMERPVLRWSSYVGWENIPEYYEVERIEPDGSILSLAKVGPMDTVYVDEITEDVGRPDYCYRVTAFKFPEHYPQIRNVWSHSNISCAPVQSRIFVPNAFTPNGDFLNDQFEVKGMYIYRYHIQIFTRWGEEIFDSESFSDLWNGQYKGAPCQEDVYIYVIDALGTDGKRYHLKGNITLLP